MRIGEEYIRKSKKCMRKDILISELTSSENKTIIEGLAMMSYIPSIGRVLEKGGKNKFTNLIIKKIIELNEIESIDRFDEWHHLIIEDIKNQIKTNKGESISYGEAQKPLNVFLKVFVDWAGRPTLEKALQLKPFLHLPLDSIVMKAIKTHFRNEWKEIVVSKYEAFGDELKKELIQSGKEVNDSDLRQLINPSHFLIKKIIFKEMYYAWQKCARAIYPERPILLDVLWSLKGKV